jgi:aromatic ring-opening dioxygenase LigB subunit
VGLVIAAIAPHGSMAIAEWCTPPERTLAAQTRAAMEDLGRRFAAASPEVTVVLTPHSIHVERAMAVVVAGTMTGTLEGGAASISLHVGVDREFAVSYCGVREAHTPSR